MTCRIVFVVAPGFELLDLSGPLCAFGLARSSYQAGYELDVVSSGEDRVASSAGLTIDTAPASRARYADTVIAIGGPNAHQPDGAPDIVDLLRSVTPTVRRVASICTGAFHLAAAGLLDGHRVTTHWRLAPLLQSRYPNVIVDPDRIYVHDRKIWTSAGITAGIDLALALIEEDFGAGMSKSVAQDMIVYHRRPGGQSQFSAILDLPAVSDRIRLALTYALEHLHTELRVEHLADAARVSSRQFARLFVQETGETPARAIERLRADAARAKVEGSREPMDVIARAVGFGDTERMRRAFLRLFGQSPQALRRMARLPVAGHSRPASAAMAESEGITSFQP